MSIHRIEKQQILHEPLSEDALKLVRAIYNTYKEDVDELYLEIKISSLLHLLKIVNTHDDNIKNYIINLFEELNEPICVKNFKFYNAVYPMKFIKFCTYKVQDEIVEIELNEEYIYAIEEYMIDPYLKG